jgi:hypothetical protein
LVLSTPHTAESRLCRPCALPILVTLVTRAVASLRRRHQRAADSQGRQFLSASVLGAQSAHASASLRRQLHATPTPQDTESTPRSFSSPGILEAGEYGPDPVSPSTPKAAPGGLLALSTPHTAESRLCRPCAQPILDTHVTRAVASLRRRHQRAADSQGRQFLSASVLGAQSGHTDAYLGRRLHARPTHRNDGFRSRPFVASS